MPALVNGRIRIKHQLINMLSSAHFYYGFAVILLYDDNENRRYSVKFLKIVLFVSLSAVPAFAFADNMTKDAVIGGGLGGALGGYIGSETGGRTGAIVGSAAGAALGSAIATDSSNHSGSKKHYGDHYIDYRPEYKKHKKHKKYKKCPPGLAMQGRC